MKQENKQQQIRDRIWKMPFLVDELFKDDDWNKFDPTACGQQVPTDDMKTFIQTAIREQEKGMEHKRSRIRSLRSYMRYTAAAAVLVFFAAQVWIWSTKEPQPLLDRDRGGATVQHPAGKDTSWILVANKTQRSKVVDLPDGSQVRLSAQSYIRYARELSGNKRDILLVGRAYFEVAADPQRPFSVFAAGTKTTALGTAFTVNTSLKNKAVRVVLHSGKVLVSATDNRFGRIFLSSPGQKLTVDRNGLTSLGLPADRPAKQKTAVPAVDLLNLKNTPMPDVLQALETVFNRQIHIGDTDIGQIRYTGQIDVHKEQLNAILTTICLINELRYVAHPDGSYTLFKQENTITEHLNN
jgi:transmembrane sensor